MTVGAAQVPSTQTDFPKLSYPTDNRFKTIGNGGHVANANGYDIRPYSDAALTTPLTYELVYYNASTGQFEMHVKIPSLSNGYVTYFGYGDASLTTDGSSTSTWSNNFLAVHHLKDGTTLSVAPSCVSTNIGTNHGATATAGEIDGGAALVSASSQYIDITDVVTLNPSAITISIWVNGTSFPNAYNSTIVRNTTGSNAFIYVKSTGKLACGAVAGGSGGATQKIYAGTGSHTLSTGTWYYLVMTYDGSDWIRKCSIRRNRHGK